MAAPTRNVPCRDCGLLIGWVTIAATGKRWSINLNADGKSGTVFFAKGGWHVVSRELAAPPGTLRYVPHFRTCIGKRAGR